MWCIYVTMHSKYGTLSFHPLHLFSSHSSEGRGIRVSFEQQEEKRTKEATRNSVVSQFSICCLTTMTRTPTAPYIYREIIGHRHAQYTNTRHHRLKQHKAFVHVCLAIIAIPTPTAFSHRIFKHRKY